MDLHYHHINQKKKKKQRQLQKKQVCSNVTAFNGKLEHPLVNIQSIHGVASQQPISSQLENPNLNSTFKQMQLLGGNPYPSIDSFSIPNPNPQHNPNPYFNSPLNRNIQANINPNPDMKPHIISNPNMNPNPSIKPNLNPNPDSQMTQEMSLHSQLTPNMNPKMTFSPNTVSLNNPNMNPPNPIYNSTTGIDMLLAQSGYTVKESDLPLLAEKIEHLDSLFASVDASDFSTYFSSVLYDPSDMAGWVESLIGHVATGEEGSFRGSFGSMDSSSSTKLGFGEKPELGPFEEVTKLGFGEEASTKLGFHQGTGEEESFYSASSAKLQFNEEPKSGVPYEPKSGFILPKLGFPDEASSKLRFSEQPAMYGNIMLEGSMHGNIVEVSMKSDDGNGISNGNDGGGGDSDGEDDGEDGIWLVQLLMTCADAIQKKELAAAMAMVKEIKKLISSSNSSGAMAKVATYFAQALDEHIKLYGTATATAPHGVRKDDDMDGMFAKAMDPHDVFYHNFYELCPYLKFSHFMANQAILEAFKGQALVHVIDFNLMQGFQWPSLMQALALRPEGPPAHLRLTAIVPPQPEARGALREVGSNLAEMAKFFGLEFSFKEVVSTCLEDGKPWRFEVQPEEALAINTIFQLHRFLYEGAPDGHMPAPIDVVLGSIKSLNPKVVTIVEQEANHNSPVFSKRFVEALHYYSTMFDSIEGSLPCTPEVLGYAELYLGREIRNIVACEGRERVERHEVLAQWRRRMMNAGFKPFHLGSDAYTNASLLVSVYTGDGYTVEETRGCLTLGWHSRPLIAASAWQCG